MSRRFREELGLDPRLHLLADEEHGTVEHYGIHVSYRNPREWVYPHGFIQPAVIAYDGDRQIFGAVQRPNALTLGGATGRPSPRRVLRAVRRSVRQRARRAGRTA